jgi:uncharacterized protein
LDKTTAGEVADPASGNPSPTVAEAKPTVVFLVAISLEALLFVPALILGFLLDTPPMARLGDMTWRPAVWGVLAALPPALVVVLLLRRRVGFAIRLLEKARAAAGPLMRLPSWQLAFVALTAGVIEEALFRGVVQTAITNGLSAWLEGWAAQACGAGVGALLFGLAHPASRAYVIVGVLFGAWMGGLLVTTDRLLTPIVAHALYDFILMLYAKSGASPRDG